MSQTEQATVPYAPPPAYTPLQPTDVASLLAARKDFAQVLGGSQAEWKVTEVGDGNLNLVFIVQGPTGAYVVKQSLPYVRCVGTSWPLSAQRAFFEFQALTKEYALAPEYVPIPHLFLPENAAFVMQFLSPHIILRKGLIRGIVYPHLAEHMSSFLANTLFLTSDFHLTTEEKRTQVALYSHNHNLCALTEQVIFQEPYEVSSNNSWTSPQLDDLAEQLRTDKGLRDEILDLRFQFQNETQALIHGDLHTGSIMVTETETKVIDPEFAFYGPMGFDIGAFVGNLIMAYFSQEAHATPENDRIAYRGYILEQITQTWRLFVAKFTALWRKEEQGPYAPSRAGAFEARFLGRIFRDSIRFAAAKILRRIFGIAHVEDFKSISNDNVRGSVERKAVLFAVHILTHPAAVADETQLVEAVRRFA